MRLSELSETPPWEWPSDARQTLLAILRDRTRNDAEREVAAELASEIVVINDEIAAALLEIVGNAEDPEDLRGGAAIALGPVLEQMDLEIDTFDDFDEPPISAATFATIKDVLRRLFLDAEVPSEVRRRILEGSVRSPADWHVGAIRAAYHANDPTWTCTAVFAMGQVAGFEEQILLALDSQDPKIRYEAVRAAGNQGVNAAWPHLRRIIRGERDNRSLLLAAIEAIPYVRPDEADELNELADSKDPEIANAASDAMAEAEAMGDDAFDFEF